MKGVVFNLLERATAESHGEDLWDDVLAVAGLDGAYTSLGSYPDAHLSRLVAAISEATEKPPDDVIRWLGRSAMPHLAASNPRFFEPHADTRDFLLTLNDIIHPEVRKLYPGADVPDFEMHVDADGGMRIRYDSHRKMCAFAEGLIQGAAAYYGQEVSISQPRCMNRGDESCDLELTFV